MDFLTRKSPWYVAGLAFQCRQCGRCCSGPEEGYVWVSEEEIADIAAHLSMDVPGFRRRFVRRAERRWSLVEQPHTRDCVFLVTAPRGAKTCLIYPVRPAQCRTWPFWESNLQNASCWTQAAARCPGVNHGPVLPCEQIHVKRNIIRT